MSGETPALRERAEREMRSRSLNGAEVAAIPPMLARAFRRAIDRKVRGSAEPSL